MTDYTRRASVLHVIRIRGVRAQWREQNARMQISDRAISLNKKCRADEGESNSENGKRTGLWLGERERERERERETGGTQASLIIGLNVANADFDESSGFECPLRYVTVTLASQLTN